MPHTDLYHEPGAYSCRGLRIHYRDAASRTAACDLALGLAMLTDARFEELERLTHGNVLPAVKRWQRAGLSIADGIAMAERALFEDGHPVECDA